MNFKRTIVIAIILLTLSALAALWLRSRSSGSATTQQHAVPEPSTNVVLACPGRIEGQSDVIEVGAAMDGVLTAVRVQEGQRVAAGYVLAQIACRDLETEVQTARALAESARQARQRLLRGSQDEERRIAAAEHLGAEAVFKQAQLQQQRMAGLYEKDDVSRQLLEQAQRDLEVAQATLQAAVDRRALINAPPLPEEIAKAEAEVQAAEERVRTATAKLEKCTVRAPISGTIVQLHLKVGESVSALLPRPIVSLADLSRLRVRAEVDERDVSRIHVGQSVTVLADAFPGRKFAGRVSQLSTQMGRKRTLTGNPAEKSDRDVLDVFVELEKTDAPLVIGLRVTAQFAGK